jgi:ATP-dependent RNA helicase RhlE
VDFTTFDLDARLLQGVTDLGFTRPTPIQEQTIPAGMAGRDLLAAAMTGSGKTAAFLLPIMHRLLQKPRGTTRVLVLTPTRELAAQILEHFELLAKHTNLTGASVFGGVAMGPQERAFRNGVDVLIATPGRLLDHLQNPYARLDKLEILVLDEADRMLDMGFLPDVRRVLAQIPKQRQTLFFSATMPNEIQRLSKEMLKDPVAFNIERKAAPATGITQVVYPVSQAAKGALLVELLKRDTIGNVIVFTRTKHRTNRLSEYLEKQGIPNARMHGNRSQAQRTDALAAFKDGSIRVLCATDIVARGIDVEQLEHVVNFDVPHMPEDYIHRVGRTARADATGEAFTFVCPEEENDLYAIERAIGRKLNRVKLDDFDYGQRPTEALEIPIGERIAAIRARKSDERARAQAKQARKTGAPAPGGGGGGGGGGGRGPGPSANRGPSGGGGGGRGPSGGGGGRGFGGGGGGGGSRGNGPRGPASGGSTFDNRAGGATWGEWPKTGEALRPRNADSKEVTPGVWRSGGKDGSGSGGR